ncbi:MAG: hypothetical protein AB7P99_03700 [Vicinamibacterales bacterium]
MKSAAAAVLAVALLAAAVPAVAQPDLWTGTWHLDLDESTYPAGSPYKRGTWKIERSDAGVTMIYDLVGVRGGVTHMEWTGRFDGRPYTLHGPDAPVTYAYIQVDAYTLDLEVRVDGVPNVRGRVTLAPDGRTLTATTTGRTAAGEVTTTTVYKKK